MVLFDYDLFVFALAERKNEKNKKIKYRSAACPEPAEGKAKNADCVSPVIDRSDSSLLTDSNPIVRSA